MIPPSMPPPPSDPDDVTADASALPHRADHARRNAWIAGLVLLLIGAAAWYLTRSQSLNEGGNIRPKTTVGIARAVRTDMPVTITAIGTVQPVTTATVRTQLAGVLFSLNFKEGQIVTKGQLLAQIDPRPYQLTLSQAQANLARDQSQLVLANMDLKRYQTLWSQDSIARQQVETQAATVKQAEGIVAADRAAIGTARLNLTYAAITAPVSGRIGLRQADLGNYLTPADTTGVAVITQTDPIDVTFSLPQEQLPQIVDATQRGQGLPVTVKAQNGTAVLAQGSFLTLDNQIDATSGTVKAKARFANPGNVLFPNQFVNVTLLATTLRQAVVVPVAAVRHGPSGDFVFLLQPNRTVKLQLVRSGPSDGVHTVMLSGVSAGAQIVVEGADSLDDGSTVTLAGDHAAPGNGAAQKGGKGRRHGNAAGPPQ